tara:strand:+ start:398 stop:721 length:324 start_codon:yes stop_codon:yes gene_type:complete
LAAEFGPTKAYTPPLTLEGKNYKIKDIEESYYKRGCIEFRFVNNSEKKIKGTLIVYAYDQDNDPLNQSEFKVNVESKKSQFFKGCIVKMIDDIVKYSFELKKPFLSW